jgi:hypothetical protein
VTDPEVWARLQHSAGAALPGSQVVKVIVDRRGGVLTPYFLDTVRYPNHVDFCRRLDPRVDAGFDTVMYRSPDRPFVLSTLTRLPGAQPEEDVYWLELWPGDNLAAEAILETLELIRGACFFGDRLLFKAASSDQRRRLTVDASPGQVARLGGLLDQGAIYRGATYQGLTLGTAYGRLRILHDDADMSAALADLTPYDVVVAEGIPLEIGPVSGLITSEHQTPLAHVAVLSANRGSPNCAVLGAHGLPEVVDLEGSWVRLEVERAGYSITAVPETEARVAVDERLRTMAERAPRLIADASRHGLPGLAQRISRDAAVVGAKSAALAALYRRRPLRRYAVPGFTVPVADYLDHVAADEDIRGAMARLDAARRGQGSAGDSVTARLADLRTAILVSEVDPALVAAIRARIQAWGPEADVIFRSSSNCEDLPGFNGAGLADSFRAAGPLTDELVSDRLRQVWASLWSDRGYAERAAFGIDQTRAAMAVLVQPVITHTAHVVAITTNTVKPGPIPAYFLNLLPSGSLVTDADSDSAEQLLLFDDRPACAEVLCFAGAATGSLLPEDSLESTLAMLRTVDRLVRRRAGGRCEAADVEFLVLAEPGPRIALLQARPYGRQGPPA